jgi:hypothetical protein
MQTARNCLSQVILSVLCLHLTLPPALAQTIANGSAGSLQEDFRTRYAAITKRILLESIALERLSLEYRKKSVHHSRLNKYIFFGTQEAGAATGLAFEATAVQQFGRARKRVLDLEPDTLGNGLRAVEIGSILSASGSGYMLSANLAKYVQSRRQGKDTDSTNKAVRAHFKEIDRLLTERQALVEANNADPIYARAIIEGKVLVALRRCFIDEYCQFSANTKSSAATENLFFLLNASYNILGAVAAEVGYKSLTKPHLNGTSNILFTVSGAMAAVAPLICAAELKLYRKHLLASQQRQFGTSHDQTEALPVLRKQLEDLSTATQQSPSANSTERLSIYSQAGDLFEKQLNNEVKTMQQLNKVALQNSIAGPVIGSLLMTQGIAGTRGYYHYFPRHVRKQFNLDYQAAICGTVGTSMALLGNASWLVASLVYEHHLKKHKRMPEQLIDQRLEHLREVESYVSSL